MKAKRVAKSLSKSVPKGASKVKQSVKTAVNELNSHGEMGINLRSAAAPAPQGEVGELKPQALRMQFTDSHDHLVQQLPQNLARDYYGITDQRVQAISFITGRACQEAVRQGEYYAASNTVGAWLVTVGERLAVLGRDRQLLAMLQDDIVGAVPDLGRLMIMISDYLEPWLSHSPEAMTFCRSLICNPATHWQVALAMLRLTPQSLAQPSRQSLYDRMLENHPDAQLAAIFHQIHYGVSEANHQYATIMAIRKTVYEMLSRRLKRYLPSENFLIKAIPEGRRRLAILMESFYPHEDGGLELEALQALLEAARPYKNLDIALYEMAEQRPATDQRGILSYRGLPTTPIGLLEELRQNLAILRQYNPQESYREKMEALLRSLFNFQPEMVLVINAPDALQKAIIKPHRAVVDWVLEGNHASFLGSHVLATASPDTAGFEIKQANLPQLEELHIMNLPDNIPLAAKALVESFIG